MTRARTRWLVAAAALVSVVVPARFAHAQSDGSEGYPEPPDDSALPPPDPTPAPGSSGPASNHGTNDTPASAPAAATTATTTTTATATTSAPANTNATTSAPASSTEHAGNHPAASTPPASEDRKLDILFVQLEGGMSYTDLTALSSQGRLIPGLVQYSGAGYGGGLTAGFRYSLFALAAHGYIARFGVGDASGSGSSGPGAFDLGQLMIEAQLRIPLPVIEPYLRAGFGYAWMGNFHLDPMYADSTGPVNGYTGKVGAGLDVWIGTMLSFGAGVDLSVMNLRRGGVQRADSSCPSSNPTCVELTQDGDAVGTLVHLHAQIALHL